MTNTNTKTMEPDGPSITQIELDELPDLDDMDGKWLLKFVDIVKTPEKEYRVRHNPYEPAYYFEEVGGVD